MYFQPIAVVLERKQDACKAFEAGHDADALSALDYIEPLVRRAANTENEGDRFFFTEDPERSRSSSMDENEKWFIYEQSLLLISSRCACGF